jgi:hypothetical protein
MEISWKFLTKLEWICAQWNTKMCTKQSKEIHSNIRKSISGNTLPINNIYISQQYPDYSIKIVGHSLGGGVAALLTIVLVTGNFPHIPKSSFPEKPNWPLFCYAYASPCVVSKSLSLKYTSTILSFALDNDPIPR